MAPLYRHLAHPTEGVLNSAGEGTAELSRVSNWQPFKTRIFGVKQPGTAKEISTFWSPTVG